MTFMFFRGKFATIVGTQASERGKVPLAEPGCSGRQSLSGRDFGSPKKVSYSFRESGMATGSGFGASKATGLVPIFWLPITGSLGGVGRVKYLRAEGFHPGGGAKEAASRGNWDPAATG